MGMSRAAPHRLKVWEGGCGVGRTEDTSWRVNISSDAFGYFGEDIHRRGL